MPRSIRITVIPSAKKNIITPTGDDQYEVRLKAKPEHNQANELLIQALAEYFSIPPQTIHILTGRHSPRKRVEIDA